LTEPASLKDFVEAEEKVEKETFRCFNKEIECYEQALNLLLETFDYVAEASEHNALQKTESVTILILPRIIHAMQSIKLLNLRGYYYDVKIIERCLIESIGLCAYLALNEEEIENYIHGRKLKVASIRLPNYIIKLIDNTIDYEGEPEYGKLSSFVHNRMLAISVLIKRETKKSRFKLKMLPEFDEYVGFSLTKYPMLMTCLLLLICKDKLGEKKKLIHDSLRRIAKNLPELDIFRKRQ